MSSEDSLDEMRDESPPPESPPQGAVRRGPQGQPGPRIDPRTVDPLVGEGKAALEKGDLNLAELRAMQALTQVPDHLEGLVLLYQCRRRNNQSGLPVENVLRRIVRRDPNLLWATAELAFMLFQRGERVECEIHARNALRLAPRNAQAHGIMGLILTETNRAVAGEFHFRRAVEIGGENTRVAANLANCLKTQGKVEESEQWYRKATALDPANAQAWLGWARLEEVRRNFARAWELLAETEKLAPELPDISLTRAVLYGREKKNEEAVEELSKSREEGRTQQLPAVVLLERGRARP